MKLSKKKQISLEEKIIVKLPLINELKLQNPFRLSDFKEKFESSAVWKIFLLHIIKPDNYPIYDQHINRAYNFIHGLDYNIISAYSMTDKEKENFYFETYMKFVDKLEGFNLRKLDQAFFCIWTIHQDKRKSKAFRMIN